MLVEEAVFQFTHDQVMDWLIPGVPPTGNRVEVGVTVLVTFEDGRIASEHLYWDHASVLAVVGVLDPAKVPIKGGESARTLLEWRRGQGARWRCDWGLFRTGSRG